MGQDTGVNDLLRDLARVDAETLGEGEAAVDLSVGTIGRPHRGAGGFAVVQAGEHRLQQRGDRGDGVGHAPTSLPQNS